MRVGALCECECGARCGVVACRSGGVDVGGRRSGGVALVSTALLALLLGKRRGVAAAMSGGNMRKVKEWLWALATLALLGTGNPRCGKEPPPRVIVDNLDLLATKETGANVDRLFGVGPLCEVDKDALVGVLAVALDLDVVHTLDRAEIEFAEDGVHTSIGNVCENTRDTNAGLARWNSAQINLIEKLIRAAAQPEHQMKR